METAGTEVTGDSGAIESEDLTNAVKPEIYPRAGPPGRGPQTMLESVMCLLPQLPPLLDGHDCALTRGWRTRPL